MTRLIDGVSSVSRPVVAGSFSDSSNISFASTCHSATDRDLTQHAIEPVLPALRGEWRQPRAFCAEELARHGQMTDQRHSAACDLQPRS